MADMLGPFALDHVHLCDAREALVRIPSRSVRLIWTDPPYGIEQNKDTLSTRAHLAAGGSERRHEQILNDDKESAMALYEMLCEQSARILIRGPCACCICAPAGGPPDPIVRHVMDCMVRHLVFDSTVVWRKSRLGCGWRYRRQHEFVLIAYPRGGSLSWFDGCMNESSVIDIASETNDEEHPNKKPIALVERMILHHTRPGEIVLDPFSGGGAVAVACARTGRRFVGFDLSQHWVDYANERIAYERVAGGMVAPEKAAAGEQVGLLAAFEQPTVMVTGCEEDGRSTAEGTAAADQ